MDYDIDVFAEVAILAREDAEQFLRDLRKTLAREQAELARCESELAKDTDYDGSLQHWTDIVFDSVQELRQEIVEVEADLAR